MHKRSLLALAPVLLLILMASTWAVAQPAPPQVIPAANPVVWGPVLSDLTPTSVRIAYKTVAPAQVTFNCDGRDIPATCTNGVFDTVLLEGLKPGVEHTYSVLCDGQTVAGCPYVFSTPAEKLQDFHFVVYGDTRSNRGDHESVVEALVKTKPALVINTGDLAADGYRESDWNTFYPVIAPISAIAPYYPALGNHERNSPLYYDFFKLPAGGGDHNCEWYSFSYGPAFFVVLDGGAKQQEQAQWLDQVLTAAGGKYRWKFVVFHQPPYSSGTHGPDAKTGQYFVPILEKHKVNMVFCGHDHIYERSEKDGVTYIIAGGGGAPRYQVDQRKNPYSKVAVSSLHYCTISIVGDSLTLEAISPDGKQLDEVTLTAAPTP